VRDGGRGAPLVIVRPKADSRFHVERRAAEKMLDRLVTPDADLAVPPRVLVIVAHPDDEAIGAGALLRGLKDVTIIHVTDGAPSAHSARRRGFRTREEYAEARRLEVLAALQLVGIGATQVRCLGMIDGEATFRLVELCHDIIELLLDRRPEIVLTHPYEGGHTDHDATAFAVHLACGILRREGMPAPVVLELTSYHNQNGTRVHAKFLPFGDLPERSLDLPLVTQILKTRMFDRFVSQQDCLGVFPVDVERFRMAPRYAFTLPPHDGPLDYERYCSTIGGNEWRARAEKALELLRGQRRANAIAALVKD
jgi:LmbE family N-acetylglucosaminyl deacetylase